MSQVVNAPTAATVFVAGRIVSATGRGIANAKVTLTDAAGNVRYAMTNPFGFYRFIEISVGETYILNATAKNKRFIPQILSLTESNENLNLIEIR